MKTRILTAGLMALAAAGLSGAAKMATIDHGPTQGVWATSRAGAVATLYADESQGAVLGFYRDQAKPGVGCDFGIAARKDGVTLQIVDEKGKVHFLPATALLKLADKAD